MNRNPDGNFVLHGRQTPIKFDNPKEYLTNSQRTISTHNLSQNTHYWPDSRSSSRHTKPGSIMGSAKNYGTSSLKLRKTLENSTSENVFDAESLFGSMNGGTAARQQRKQQRKQRSQRLRDTEFSLDFTGLGNSLNKSLNKSVSFSEQLERHKDSSRVEDDQDDFEDSFEEELQNLIDSEIRENDRYEQDLAGKPKNKTESQWFVEPVHLTKPDDYPVFQSLGVDTMHTLPVNRTAGMLGTELAQQKIANQMLLDDIAHEHFPVTLGQMPSIMRTVTPPPPNSYGKQYVRLVNGSSSRNGLRSTERLLDRQKSESRLSDETKIDPKVSAVYDYNYLRASQPFIDQTVTASPYQYELAQLKMERLRLEEQRLLESKRQEELERIRGPTPKWYELKTPQFTYELHKNNKLLESKKDWQSLMDYREQLTKSSQDFGQTELGGYLY